MEPSNTPTDESPTPQNSEAKTVLVVGGSMPLDWFFIIGIILFIVLFGGGSYLTSRYLFEFPPSSAMIVGVLLAATPLAYLLTAGSDDED